MASTIKEQIKTKLRKQIKTAARLTPEEPSARPEAQPSARPEKQPSAKPEKQPKPAPEPRAKVLKSKVSFQGKVFSVTTDKVTEPGGYTATRDVIRHNGSVVVLAVDASKDAADPSILIERQYRYAAGQFLLELPAGRIEPGEKPMAAAKRELIEETGYRAKRWSKLVRYYASPGFLAETMQVFLAEDLREGRSRPEPDEQITLQLIPLSQLLDHIEEGHILDGKTILSVLLFARHLAGR